MQPTMRDTREEERQTKKIVFYGKRAMFHGAISSIILSSPYAMIYREWER